jgi:ketosteroid isomerase-like protein
MIIGVLVAMAVATVAAQGTGQPRSAPRDVKDLTELQQTLARAWVGGDRPTIERIIAPDWMSTGPDGRTMARADVLAEVFENRRHKILSVEIGDVDVRVFGDAAVVTGRTHGVGEVQGSRYDVFIRFTDTFVRRDGRWQAVASHASLLAEPK